MGYIMPSCLACEYNRLPTEFLTVSAIHHLGEYRVSGPAMKACKYWIIQVIALIYFCPGVHFTCSKAKYRAFLSVEILLWLQLLCCRMSMVGGKSQHCHLWQCNTCVEDSIYHTWVWRNRNIYSIIRLMVENSLSRQTQTSQTGSYTFVTESLHCSYRYCVFF